MKTVMQALQEMRDSVESLDASKTERINAPSIGDVIRQGDIYITFIDRVIGGKVTENKQLAPGSTQGSRHILDGECTVYENVGFRDFPSALVGPAVICESDVTITHPEHGHKIIPAGSVIQITYQRAFAEEIRRVQD